MSRSSSNKNLQKYKKDQQFAMQKSLNVEEAQKIMQKFRLNSINCARKQQGIVRIIEQEVKKCQKSFSCLIFNS